jgi:hypothetical protein
MPGIPGRGEEWDSLRPEGKNVSGELNLKNVVRMEASACCLWYTVLKHSHSLSLSRERRT